jgi:hypothetical protein
MKTPENTEEDRDDPEPVDGGLLWLVVQHKYRSSNKKLPVRI